jgi:hypothetical protein
MIDFRIPLGQWVKAFIDFVTDNLAFLFDFIRVIF